MFLENDFVLGRVNKVEEYGIYLDCNNHDILVLIVDVSSERICELRAKFALGKEIKVRILAYVPEKKIYKGTMIGTDET